MLNFNRTWTRAEQRVSAQCAMKSNTWGPWFQLGQSTQSTWKNKNDSATN